MGIFSRSGGGGGSVSSGGGGGGFGLVDAPAMRKAFERFMDEKGVKYSVLDEDDNIVYLSFGGSKYETFVFVDFDENVPCNSAHFSSNGFAKIIPGKNAEALVKLNELNRRFRWVKFWMDGDGIFTADCDAIVELGSVGDECVNMAFRLSNITEDALDELQGIATVNKEQKDQFDLVAAIKRMGAL